MGKKILVLNGSPRPDGNTSALIEAFTRGAEGAGHTVTAFLLDRMDIHFCKGCYGGGKDRQSPCMQKDDMDKIYPAYWEADVLVFGSPLYFWTLSGQLRTAVDRLFAIAECDPGHRPPRKQCVLLMAAAGDDYGEVRAYHKSLMQHLGWQMSGEILAGGAHDPGDLDGRPELQQAEELGRSI